MKILLIQLGKYIALMFIAMSVGIMLGTVLTHDSKPCLKDPTICETQEKFDAYNKYERDQFGVYAAMAGILMMLAFAAFAWHDYKLALRGYQ